MAYIFLSHSHADKPFARKLAADLRNAGHSVWIDEAEINIGDSLIGKIRSGLDQVDFVCAILSQASIKSAWVEKELEIASNREIDERRVVVLPLLVEDVPLPRFLQGKYYGDFRKKASYKAQFETLKRSLGPSNPVQASSKDEIAQMKKELNAALAFAKDQEAAAARANDAAFRAKSPEVRAAIEAANTKFPQHAPINRTYAFEVGGSVITLDYALWAISKSERKGSHPLAALLTIFDKWKDIENMIEAYRDMVERQAPA
ncbi:TIR domain-containing protein [Bradyrhizobium sp. CSA112]|uniref:toll/interleukin-1 receptor domain-containing protein n=1 Tax=Bradyrhizobium sp. CSA112 TaxID=2699170 RepID=UPI0023B003DE|nr:toll/interleukin-1 receptor domain-containing protein [Bradyrhizobium sp. CSA112]MDE5457965.1 TIR domain-containing protein [Bradyrhizobium sp. CSA112]